MRANVTRTSSSFKLKAPNQPFRFLCCFLLLAGNALALDRPNIIYFLADDLGWTDVGWHGSEIMTPNLDKLAMDGARLEQFYVLPVCSPTRAAFMTGRYPIRHGLQLSVVRPYAQYGLPLDERTLPQALKEAGYQTAMSGKWHLGHFHPDYLPTRRGFDSQYGHYNGALDYFTHERDGGHDWHRNDRESRDPGYTTTLIGDEAVRVVEQLDAKTPLFMYVPFNAPHSPLQVTEEYLKHYSHITDKKRQSYAAMVHCLDEQVGKVVAAIEKRGLTSNTLFLFSSDNGGPLNQGATNGSLRAGKATLYEGGTRVVAFANWKGKIQPGTIVNEPLHIVDWYPTLLKLVGVSIDQRLALDGLDMWSTITQGKPSPHASILINSVPQSGAIRMGDWKLVVNGSIDANDLEGATDGTKGKSKKKKEVREVNGKEQIELFNLADDPGEKKNLAGEQAAKVQELRAKLDAFAKEAVPPKAESQPSDFKVPKIWGETPQ
ncbi:MAG: arylsulfatase [Pirellulaceae bacterium]|nr:arylsulfatase [Pirellulaceae bacterium]